MYKHILVAVDSSDRSDHALHEVISFTKDQQAELLIIHAVDEVNINSSTELANPGNKLHIAYYTQHADARISVEASPIMWFTRWFCWNFNS